MVRNKIYWWPLHYRVSSFVAKTADYVNFNAYTFTKTDMLAHRKQLLAIF